MYHARNETCLLPVPHHRIFSNSSQGFCNFPCLPCWKQDITGKIHHQGWMVAQRCQGSDEIFWWTGWTGNYGIRRELRSYSWQLLGVQRFWQSKAATLVPWSSLSPEWSRYVSNRKSGQRVGCLLGFALCHLTAAPILARFDMWRSRFLEQASSQSAGGRHHKKSHTSLGPS